ncbi:hypothetical protein N7504_010397 [Penicillium tannophilum]|nr:hypothetical protein N7504_010397 [Penicillium tannophilum]
MTKGNITVAIVVSVLVVFGIILGTCIYSFQNRVSKARTSTASKSEEGRTGSPDTQTLPPDGGFNYPGGRSRSHHQPDGGYNVGKNQNSQDDGGFNAGKP